MDRRTTRNMKQSTNNASVWRRFLSAAQSRKFIRLSALTAIFITIILLNLASALAYYQSHNLSEIRNIDTNLDMGTYDMAVDTLNITGLGSGCNLDTTLDGRIICGSDSYNNGWYFYVDNAYEETIGEYEILDFNSGSGISISYDGTDDVTITNTGDLSTSNELQNLFRSFDTPSGTDPVADTTADTLQFLAGTGVTITGDSAADSVTFAVADTSATNELQNLWSTVNSQSGSTSADSQTDTLTINGAGIASTAVSGDTLTITATEVDGSTSNEIQDVMTSGGLQRDGSNDFGLIDCSTGQILKDTGSNTWGCAADDGVTGSGSDGHISYWSGSGSQTYDSDYDLYWDDLNNRLGIGTTNPIAQLEIEDTYAGIVSANIENLDTGSNSHARVYLRSADAGDAYTLYSVGSGSTYWNSGIDNSDSDKFKISNAVTPSLASYLTIDTSGNVGIGTSSPEDKLHVDNGRIVVGDTASSYHVNISQNDINFRRTTGGNSYITQYGDAGLAFRTNGANERMVIESDGDVGIGTTTPASTLSVGGSGYANTGVYGYGSSAGVYGSGGTGIHGSGNEYAGYFSNLDTSGTNYGVYGRAVGSFGSGGTTHYGGYFVASSGSSNYGIRASGSDADIYAAGTCYDGTSGSCSLNDIAEYVASRYSMENYDCDMVKLGEGHWTTENCDWRDGAEPEFEIGDVVCLDPEFPKMITLCDEAYDHNILSVVNYNATMLFGTGKGRAYPLSLAGNIPVNVICDDPIIAGDLLVTADEPGYAMKLDLDDESLTIRQVTGTVFAKATENCGSGRKTIRAWLI